MQRCLAADPQVAEASHVGSTQAAADRQAGRPPAVTRAEWRRAADRTLELIYAAGDPGAEVAVHGMRLPLGMLLVVRVFELWVHDNDIRQAAGLPPAGPDASTLSLMTQAAAQLLPHAAARVGLREPTSVHLVLTGPGGGTWDIPIGHSPPAPAPVGIVTDVVGFCPAGREPGHPRRAQPAHYRGPGSRRRGAGGGVSARAGLSEAGLYPALPAPDGFLVVQRQVTFQVTGVPAAERGGQGFQRCRHDCSLDSG